MALAHSADMSLLISLLAAVALAMRARPASLIARHAFAAAPAVDARRK